jgi:hypothetical protein
VTGAVDAQQIVTNFTLCNTGYITTGDVLVQATITIVQGQCAGMTMNNGVVKLCTDGKYIDDSAFLTNPAAAQSSSAIHQGLNATNVVAFLLTNTGENSYIQDIYING